MTTATSAIADPFFRVQHERATDAPLNRWRKRLAILLIAGVAAWAVVAFLVGPPVIRSGYANTSPIGAINRAFEYRDQYPLSHYVGKWNRLALAALSAWVGFGALLLFTTSRTFVHRMVGTATPGALGATRMLICLILAIAAWDAPITTVAPLPLSERQDMGAMNYIYSVGPHARGLPIGFDQLVRSESALAAFKAVTITVLLAAAIGWKTRLALVVGFALTLPLLGIVRSYSWMGHTGLVPLYCLFVLMFTRCGEGWSVDRVIAQWRGRPVPPADAPTAYYAWARHATWVPIAMVYLAAGLCKIFNDNWRWWEGVNLQRMIYQEALRPGVGEGFILGLTWIPNWAFTVIGIMSVLIELGMALVLVSWVARMVVPVMALGMHTGIYIFQHILFRDLIIIQLLFYDWTKARHAIGRRIAARRGSIDVLYDGRCSICQRSVRLLKGWDLFDRLNYLDFRTLDVAAYNAGRGVTLDPRALDEAMHVVARGRVTRGFEGCRTIAGALPMFWLIAPLLYVPGISHVGAAAYRWLARNRMAFHTCRGGACALPTREEETPAPSGTSRLAARMPLASKLAGPIALAVLIGTFFAVWATRLEWYPLSSAGMFSAYDNRGILTYFKCYATDAQGNTYEAPLEKMGRGTARYRPVMSGGFYNANGRRRCIQMLEFCGAYHNAANPQNPVVKLEVQKRVWDFLNDRKDPNYGQPVDRITVTFPAETGASASR